MEAFRNYIAKRPERHSILDDSLKFVAFNLTRKDPNGMLFKVFLHTFVHGFFTCIYKQIVPRLFKVSSEAFRFAESPQLFESAVRDLIAKHNYTTAAKMAEFTGVVHEDFLYGFLVPIAFARNQSSTLYDYLEVGKSLQVPLLQILDSLMTNDTEQQCRRLVDRHNYRNIPNENMTFEYLRKNIPKLRKKFDVPVDATPNVAHQQNISAVEYWIRQLAMCEAGEQSN